MRVSKKTIPIYVTLVAGAGALVWMIPRWWSWTILIITGLTLVGDIVNVVYGSWAMGRHRAGTADTGAVVGGPRP